VSGADRWCCWPALPARTIPEVLAYARTPGVKISMASSGTGTITHVAGELFKLAAEIPMLHVPYRGEAPAITDMIAGQVQVMFANLPPALEHVRAGRLHALAVTTAQRSPVLPEVSAMTEYLPGYEASGWQGLGAPVGTEDPIVQQLSREVQSALGENAMHDRLAALGVDPLLLPKNEFDRFVTAETEKWAKVVRSARIKPD
jgi:tripartite-type tricarboxylate transporter receptor subunit TctC